MEKKDFAGAHLAIILATGNKLFLKRWPQIADERSPPTVWVWNLISRRFLCDIRKV